MRLTKFYNQIYIIACITAYALRSILKRNVNKYKVTAYIQSRAFIRTDCVRQHLINAISVHFINYRTYIHVYIVLRTLKIYALDID